MSKKIRNNIINEYTEEVICDYFNLPFINKIQQNYIKKWFLNLKNSNEFIHITSSEDNIKKNKKLLCSSGGLGAVLYVTPLQNDKMNNLGSYIYNKEMPMFLKNSDKKISCIKISFKNSIKIGYVDYLSFGIQYYDILKNQIDQSIKEKMYRKSDEIITKIDRIILLSKSNNNWDEIFDILNTENVFKIFLFEIITEFILFYNNDLSCNDACIGFAKDLIYSVCPKLQKKFALENFEVSCESLKNIIKISGKFEIKNDCKYIINRLIHYFEKYLINNQKNLYGQILFRNLNFRKYLEESFSKKIWKEAIDNNYDVVTYILPKGEMGIFPSKNIKIFSTKVKEEKCFEKIQFDAIIVSNLSQKSQMR